MSYQAVAPGARVTQHLKATVIYSLDAREWGPISSVTLGRVRPAHLGYSLSFDVVPEGNNRRVRTLIEVSKGVAGAVYELRCGLSSFFVRVSSKIDMPEVTVEVKPRPQPMSIMPTTGRTRQRK